MADRFSCLVVVLATLILWGSVGSADFKTRDESDLHILTYKQMLKLPLVTRANYIRDMRKFMIRQEQQYPGAWNAAAKSASTLVPGIDDILWSKALADDNPSLPLDPKFDQNNVAALIGNYQALDKYLYTSTYEQMNPVKLGFAPPPDTFSVAGNQTQAPTVAPAKVAAGAPPSNQPHMDEITVIGHRIDQSNCGLEQTCYFAGNRSTRINCECYASKIEDPVARKDTASCNSGTSEKQVACNRILFGAKPDGSAFCAPRGKNASQYCNDTGMSPGDAAKNFGKIPEKDWNQYREAFRAYCDAYRTPDCSTLKTRLETNVANGPAGPYIKPLCAMHVDPSNGSPGGELFLVGSSNDPSIGDPNNKEFHVDKFTDLSFKMKAGTAEDNANFGKDASKYAGDFQDIPGIDISKDPATNSLGVTHLAKIGNKIKIDPQSGQCTAGNDSTQAINRDAHDACRNGSIFCTVQAHPQVCDTKNMGASNFKIKVGKNGNVTEVHTVDDGHGNEIEDSTGKLKNTSYRKTSAVDTDIKNLADKQGQDYADLLNWGKESSDSSKGDQSQEFHQLPSALFLGKNGDFINAVNGSPGMDPKNCPNNKWIYVGKPMDPIDADGNGTGRKGRVATWRGADETIFLACGDLKNNSASDLSGRSFIKIHNKLSPDGTTKIIAVETGTLDHAGRPLDTEIFRDGETQPYLTITHDSGTFLSRTYKVVENKCPSKNTQNPFPFTVIVKSPPVNGQSSYMACHAEMDVEEGYSPWKMHLEEHNGVLSGHSDDDQDAREADFKFSVDTDRQTDPKTCAVQKKAQGASEFFPVLDISPLPHTLARRPQPQGDGSRAN